jgi:hypothetical protein
MRDAARKGRTVRVGNWKGTNNPKVKLSAACRAELVSELSKHSTYLSEKYGISVVRVNQIRREVKKSKAGWEEEEF